MAQGGFASTQSVTTLARLMRQQQQQMATADAIQHAAAVAMSCARSHMAVGVTTALLVIGTSQDITVTWPGNAFVNDQYEVDIIPTGNPTGAACTKLSQTANTVTVRVTATALLAIGTQFLVYGATNFA